MTRTMYDGLAADAPAIRRKFPDAAMVGGYIDGKFAWSQADWNLFPRAVHVTITVLGGSRKADVCDCETGDLTPAHAAQWVRDRKAEGYARPTIYCSRSVIPAVRTATGSLILDRDYDIWCADYTNTAHQVTAPGQPPATCAATQYLSTGTYDASAVYDDGWPHRTAPKPPAPKPSEGPSFSQPRHVTVRAGDSTVAVLTCLPPAYGGPPDHYMVDVFTGSFPSPSTHVASYPRRMDHAPQTFGSLQEFPSGQHMTCRVTAVDAAGNVSAYTDVSVQMP